MSDRKYTTTVVGNAFSADDQFDDWDTVAVADAPHARHFGTDTFRTKRVPVTKTGVQTYNEGGTEVTMRKTREELADAAWSLDNRALIAHRDHGTPVASAGEVLGFVRDPSFVGDKQYVDVYIPVGGGAEEMIADGYTDVSVGFHHDYRDDDEADLVQSNIMYDHVAICPRGMGRWSHSDGVGLTADTTAFSGITSDADNHRFTEGDWVRWEFAEGSAVGQVVEWTDDGELSVEGGKRVTNGDERVYKLRHWDDGEFGNMVVKSDSELSEASEPDSFESDTSEGDGFSDTATANPDPDETVELTFNTDAETLSELDLTPPEAVQENAQMALDLREEHPDEVDAMGETGWARARQLASGEELSPADISDGTDGMANWWARHKPHTVEDGSLKRNEDVKRWKDNSYVAGKGWGGVEGMQWAMRMDEKITDIRSDMTDPTDLFVGHGGYSKTTVFASDTTVMDTITFEGTRNGTLDESDIPKDEYEAHYVFDADTKTASSFPLVDGDRMLRRGNVKSAFNLRGHAEDESFLIDVLAAVNDEFDDPPIDNTNLTQMANDSMTNTDTDSDDTSDPMFDVSDFTVDALASEHDGVAELRSDKQELEKTLDDLRSDMEDMEEELASYRADERQSLIDEITSITSKWSTDTLEDDSLDELERKRDLATDFKDEFASDATVTDVSDFNADGRGGSGGSNDSDSTYVAGESYDLSDTA